MELLIEQIFRLSSGRTVFACKLPISAVPNQSKFEAFVKSSDSKKVAGPFTVYKEHIKRTTLEPDTSIAFASAEKIEVDEKALLAEPHFLALQ
jgi:hypothetical protein